MRYTDWVVRILHLQLQAPPSFLGSSKKAISTRQSCLLLAKKSQRGKVSLLTNNSNNSSRNWASFDQFQLLSHLPSSKKKDLCPFSNNGVRKAPPELPRRRWQEKRILKRNSQHCKKKKAGIDAGEAQTDPHNNPLLFHNLKKPDTLSSSTHLPAASWATRFRVIRTEITFAYNTDEFEEFSPQSDCKLECWQALQIQ